MSKFRNSIVLIFVLTQVISAQNSEFGLGGNLSLNVNSNILFDQLKHKSVINFSIGGSLGFVIDYKLLNKDILSSGLNISFYNYEKYRLSNGDKYSILESFIEFPLVYRNIIPISDSCRAIKFFVNTGLNFSIPIKSIYYNDFNDMEKILNRKLKFSAILGLGVEKKLRNNYYLRIDVANYLYIIDKNMNENELYLPNIDRFSLLFGLYKNL